MWHDFCAASQSSHCASERGEFVIPISLPQLRVQGYRALESLQRIFHQRFQLPSYKGVCQRWSPLWVINIKHSFLKKAMHSFGISHKYIKGVCSELHFYAYPFFLSFLPASHQTLSPTIHVGLCPGLHLQAVWNISQAHHSRSSYKRVKSFVAPASRYGLWQPSEASRVRRSHHLHPDFPVASTPYCTCCKH